MEPDQLLQRKTRAHAINGPMRLCPRGWRNLETCEHSPKPKLTLVKESLECDVTVSGAEQMEFPECFCWVPN